MLSNVGLWNGRGPTMGSYYPLTDLTFDAKDELLWISDSWGFVRAYQPKARQETVEWHANSAFNYYNSPCLRVVSTADIIWTAGLSAIRGLKRGGLPLFSILIPSHKQARIFNIVPHMQKKCILMYGETPGIMQVYPEASDKDNEIIVTHQDYPAITSMALTEKYVITGASTGDVALRDPSTLQMEIRLRSDVRVSDIIMGSDGYTCTVAAQSAVQLFDIRRPNEMLARYRAPAPVSSLCQGAVDGNLLTLHRWDIDVLDPATLTLLYSMNLVNFFNSIDEHSYTSMAVSQNGTSLAVGSDKGVFCCFTHASVPCIKERDLDTEYQPFTIHDERKTPIQASPPFVRNKWRTSDNVNETDVGFDGSYVGKLASDWPPPHYMILACEPKAVTVPQHLQEYYKEVQKNRHQILRSDTFRVNPKDKLSQYIPNPYPFNCQLGDDPSKVWPALVQMRKLRKSGRLQRSDNLAYSRLDDASQVCYITHRTPLIDWDMYNLRRDHVGLDNSLRESWINPILHCLFYLNGPGYGFRKTVIRHTCRRFFCLTCEMGLLFQNMCCVAANKAQPISQPTNLLRTIRQLPRFKANNVFDPAASRDDAVAKCHTCMRLILEQMDEEFRTAPSLTNSVVPSDYISSVFGMTLQSSSNSQSLPPRFYWDVPACATKVDEGLQHLLKQLERFRNETVTINRLPRVILLLLNPEHGHLKPPPSLKFSRGKEEYTYALTSNILHFAQDAEDPGNFVLHWRSPREKWVVLNDYYVSDYMESEESLEPLFPRSSTHATVVTCYIDEKYRAAGAAPNEELLLQPFLFSTIGDIIVNDWAAKELTAERKPPGPLRPLRTQPLSTHREIMKDDLIALDAEYILLEWGNEPREEPTWFVRNPHMSLARVSCLLSQHVSHEQVIIDDYISATEPVQDYVTQYSGIYEGDLDPARSPYQLTSLKAAVLKLRCLLDRGVKFVGHGLAQDFRVINLAVPADRIVDTLELFHRPGQRFLSLRFLAYHLLNERVQDSVHDSIEDARTSLRLYRKHQELFARGELESALDMLLKRGAETNWYVPDAAPSSISPTPCTLNAPTTENDALSPGTMYGAGPIFLSAPVGHSPDVPSSLTDG